VKYLLFVVLMAVSISIVGMQQTDNILRFSQPKRKPPVSQQLKDWDAEFLGGGYTENLIWEKESTNNLPSLAFPQPGGYLTWLCYLVATQFKSTSISGTLTMTVEVSAVGQPVFNWQSEADNTCYWNPATVRPFFAGTQTQNFNTTGRWWAAPPNEYILAPGTATITVPLTPDNWVDVQGEKGTLNSDTLAGFASSIKSVMWIGMTFGGGCFYSHGVNVSGVSAEFKVLDYQIAP